MKKALLSTLAILASSSAYANPQTDLQQELEALKARISELEQQSEAQQQAIDATADAVESSAHATSPVHIAGYGELHYNNLSGKGGASDKEEIDFHRFVLEFGYDFTDDIRFFSELELEHSLSGDGKPGEVELEQAFVDFDINAQHTVRGGLFLLPVGLLNTTHEPNTFYGVERNPVEKNILPTTWWEGGAGAYGQLGNGFSYDIYLHSGLNTNAGKNYAIRNGRQKVAEAEAKHWASTARLSWNGIPGLSLSAVINYQDDLTQGNDVGAGSAVLTNLNAVYQSGPFALRALYARWDLQGDGPESVGADLQQGWYIEPSFKLHEQWGLFARYNAWDNQAGDSSRNGGKVQYDAGINYWPHPQVVVKADYQYQDNDNGKDQNGINLGIGYAF